MYVFLLAAVFGVDGSVVLTIHLQRVFAGVAKVAERFNGSPSLANPLEVRLLLCIVLKNFGLKKTHNLSMSWICVAIGGEDGDVGYAKPMIETERVVSEI